MRVPDRRRVRGVVRCDSAISAVIAQYKRCDSALQAL